jgi:glycosyltransferase involved in cell wall biosynthesis
MNINLHIYPTPFQFESRILRETESLINFKLVDQILIVSTWKVGLKENEFIDEQRTVRRLKSAFNSKSNNTFTKIIRYFEFHFQVLKLFKNKKINTINCHSLFVLPIGVILKLLKSDIKVIYDAHELETHKTGLNRFMIILCVLLEKILMRYVDRVIVVSPSIAKFYESKYKRPIFTLRNISEQNTNLSRNYIFNDKFNIPKQDLIFIYQGLLNMGRGVDLLIEVFKNIEPNKHLIFMGYGPLEKIINEEIQNKSNIHFMPAVKPSEILSYTCGADIGLCIIENISLSYYYCLPNKFFEYLHSGLPVMASNFPDMTELIDYYNCGWSVNVEKFDIQNLINRINFLDINNVKNGVSKIREELTWQSESIVLKEIYK